MAGARAGAARRRSDPVQVPVRPRYLVDNGVKWRALPGTIRWHTVYYHSAAWHRRSIIAFLRDQFRRQIRTGQGRCPWPVTLIVDSQSVKGAETVQGRPRLRRREKMNGRKRHIAVDTLLRTHAGGRP
ncbi:hypothetical protein [Streptomyces sp. NPDC006863]|uniref:hypothetical protein n=1 Tax=unclassified Streptomyces TaxID=2593676 RepID=UPI0033D41F10